MALSPYEPEEAVMSEHTPHTDSADCAACEADWQEYLAWQHAQEDSADDEKENRA